MNICIYLLNPMNKNIGPQSIYVDRRVSGVALVVSVMQLVMSLFQAGGLGSFTSSQKLELFFHVTFEGSFG